ncbi:GL20993 [Drosophila persimilis]|uniref:GL20993 n=1 Tax=Drosophila persimilis TaxID=7234 RepID=B4H825_DROPE|nr:GL20993 [Drosophila persimilis]
MLAPRRACLRDLQVISKVAQGAPKPKRNLSTLAKNKETLIFGKLNSTVGYLDAEETDELMDSETLSAGAQEWPNEALCTVGCLDHMDIPNLRPLHTDPGTRGAPNPKPQSGSMLRSWIRRTILEVPQVTRMPSVNPCWIWKQVLPLSYDIQSNDLQEITAAEQTADIELFDK